MTDKYKMFFPLCGKNTSTPQTSLEIPLLSACNLQKQPSQDVHQVFLKHFRVFLKFSRGFPKIFRILRLKTPLNDGF